MKGILLIVILLIPQFAKGQSIEKDSLSDARENIQVSIAIDDLNSLKTENNKLKHSLNNLKEKFQKVQTRDSINSLKLKKIEGDYNVLKNKHSQLEENQKEANKKLVNISSNFLYIPFEAYSIREIAIPAFEAISDDNLKREHYHKYSLLKDYEKHLKELLNFVDMAETELNKPFTKHASAVIDILNNEQFYLDYKEYDDWSNTYIGKYIISIENQLKMFNGNDKKVKFNTIKQEVEECLKSLESL